MIMGKDVKIARVIAKESQGPGVIARERSDRGNLIRIRLLRGACPERSVGARNDGQALLEELL